MRKVALVTVVGNGGKLFKIWYKYYTQFFKPENIYLIAYGSTDGSTSNLDCNIASYPNEKICPSRVPQHNVFLNNYKSKLLKNYDYIVYADYDEIIYHPKGLDKFINTLKDNYCNPFGYEIVQTINIVDMEEIEPSFDYTKSVLSQRNNWLRNTAFDKPLITSMDFSWAQGNHAAYASIPTIAAERGEPKKHTLPPKNVKVRLPNIYKDGLYLVHLKHIDFKAFEKRYPKKDLRKHWLNISRKLQPIPKELIKKNFI